MKTADTIFYEHYGRFTSDKAMPLKEAMISAMEEYKNQFQKDDRAAKTATWIDCEVALPTKTGNYEVWDDNSPLTNKIYVMRFDKYNETWLEGEDTYHPQKWRQQSLPPESNQVNT